MKHTFSKLSLTVLLLVGQLCMFAAEFTVDGIKYSTTSEKTVKVVSTLYGGDRTIPEEVKNNGVTYSVTSIGKNAFYDSGLTSVTIPNSVTSIGENAFYHCEKLERVNISDIKSWCGIAFSDYSSNPLTCAHHLYLNGEEIKDLIIPNSVTSIGKYAFSDCSSLSSVTIPNSVRSIGDGAFSNCDQLQRVNISDIKSWCGIAFYSSTSNPLNCAHHLYLNGEEIKDLIIPNSVTSIGKYAFCNCSSLSSVTIPNSVRSIGDDAFYNCDQLQRVNISDIKSWCGIAFGSNPLYYAHHLYLNGEEIKDLIIPNSVTSIGSSAFYGCSGLTSITIPNSVTSIGDNAFSRCTGLPSITIPNSVTSIGNGAFSRSGLTSVTIPNSVTSIGIQAFYGCTGLTSVTIPNSVTEIGYETFYNCSGLTSITIPNSVRWIDNRAFYGCSGLAEVTIPNSVTSIGESAFYNCSGLTEVTIPNSVTSIKESAFYNCSGLTAVTIGNSVTSIGYKAFYGCSGLTAVTIGNSVTTIREYAFYGCSGLTSISIPGSVTNIRELAFGGCDILKIALESIKPPSLLDGSFSTFSTRRGVLYVPLGFKTTYKNAYGWKNFINIVESDYITGVSLSPASMTFSALNATQALTATFTPSNATYNTLTWTSSDETVATVDENGVVTSKNYGTATITATTTDGSNKSATCSVTVSTTILVTGVSLNKTSLNFSTLNATQTLTATVSPDNATNKNLKWTSSNTNVATISSNGVVTAKGNGTATITATTTDGSNKSATCSVTVSAPILVTGVSLKITSLSFSALNTTQALTAIVTPSNAANKTLTWTSSNTNVATVSSSGVVTSKGNGTATITAKATDGSNKSATCSVTVSTPIPATGVFLNKTSLTFSALNTTQTLTATVTPSNAANKNLEWTSSNNSVATVSSSGVVTSKGNGTATITATTTDGSNKSAKCTVTVSAPTLVSSISLNNTSLFFSAPNSTQTLTATVTPSNAANKNLEWTSSNNSVATVSSSGVVTSKGNGTATITARATDGSNTSATCIVTVGIPVVGISLSNTSLTFSAIDSKETLTATVTPSNAANKNLEWTSSNPDVATVTSLISSRGVVTAKGSGTATITARAKDGSNISATCTVTVTIPVDGISLSNTSLTFTALNTTQTLTATVTPSSAANKKLTWTSSNTNVATVNSNGVVTSQGNGTATITAKATDGSNISATCSVTVSAPILVTGVSLNKTSLTFSALNTTQTLTATVTPSNATNKTLTWTSSNNNVATVNIYGVVTSKGYGTATITATANDGSNKSTTCSVTVAIPKYTLKFVADGKVVSEKSVEYGSAITAPKAPAKTGYTFVSWGNVAATMPAKNVTYTAQYKVNQYKLTYLIDGRVYKTYTLDYNSVINPEGEAEDDDYYYGWEEVPNRMPDHDVTVNAYITGIAAAGKGITNGKYEIYTIDGKKLNNLQKGVNIIRFVNGITKKIVK